MMLHLVCFAWLVVAYPLCGLTLPNGQEVEMAGPLLGGLSGARNYLVTDDCSHYALRYLDLKNSTEIRRSEIQAAQFAAALGVGPQVYATGEEHDWMLMAFIAGGTLDSLDESELPELINTFRRLHSAEGDFPPGETVIQLIRRQLATATSRGVPMPRQPVQSALAFLDRMEERFASRPLVPCHHDLSALNILRDGDQYKVIDWTEAGMSYAMADLSFFMLVNRLDESQSATVLRHYFLREPQAEELDDLRLMRAVNAIRIFAANFPAYQGSVDDTVQRNQKIREHEARFLDPDLPGLDHYFAMHARGELAGTETILDYSLRALNVGLAAS